MTFGDFIKEKEKIDDVLDLTLPSLSDRVRENWELFLKLRALDKKA